MSRSRTASEALLIWAIPISRETVAVWSELPATASEVAIALADADATLCFKRRLITPGRRLHLFVFRTAQFNATKPCLVTYRRERAETRTRCEAPATLAEWNTPSIAAVVRAIVEGLAAQGDGEDTRLLARFLSLKSSWAAPCRYHGAEYGLCAAVFEFVPSADGPITLFAVEGGAVSNLRVTAVAYDEHSCCLVWQGGLFDRAYFELEGELLEFNPHARRQVPEKPLGIWFAERTPEQQDGMLDGWVAGAARGEPIPLGPIGAALSSSRDLRRGRIAVKIEGLFAAGRRLYLLAEVPTDWDTSFDLSLSDVGDISFRHDVSPMQLPGERPDRRLQICRADLSVEVRHQVAARLVVGGEMEPSPLWLAVQSLDVRSARRRLRGLIPWDVADNGLVSDLANALAAAGTAPSDQRPAAVTIHNPGKGPDGPLLICHFDGDSKSAEATLLGVRSTFGEEAAVRLVYRGRLSSDELIRLHSLCQGFGLRVDLVAIEAGAPFSEACALRPGDRRHGAVLFARTGMVPIDPDWWPKLTALVGRNERAVYWFPLAGSPAEASALAFASGESPVVAFGPDVDEAVVAPPVELMTFEGFLAHAIKVAARGGKLERTASPRFAALLPGTSVASFGEARLDDAVVAAALAAQDEAAKGDKVVALENREAHSLRRGTMRATVG